MVLGLSFQKVIIFWIIFNAVLAGASLTLNAFTDIDPCDYDAVACGLVEAPNSGVESSDGSNPLKDLAAIGGFIKSIATVDHGIFEHRGGHQGVALVWFVTIMAQFMFAIVTATSFIQLIRGGT